jgi:hypothetical protein
VSKELLRGTLSTRFNRIAVVCIYMSKPRHLCINCRQDFTRKWNAQRHNNLLHNGRATIVPIKNYRYGFPHNAVGANANHDLDYKLECMAPGFEQFELELRTQRLEQKDKILGFAVCKAITTDDPAKTMKSMVESIRKERIKTKMLDCASNATQLPPLTLRELLKIVS